MPYLRKQLTIVMQEPLLFNESIKENILFGDQFASDPKIREVCIQTNSLPFIMQTEDDFSSPAVKSKLMAAFTAIADRDLRRNPGIKNEVTEMLRTGAEKDFKTLFFLN